MKTTSKHFKIFKKECQYWVDKLGLKDWEIVYSHQSVNDDSKGNFWVSLENKNANINLEPDWGNYYDPPTFTKEGIIKEVKRTAFHEVAEVMLARLNVLGISRFVREGELVEATHDVIRRLENLVFEANRNG